MLQTRMHQLKPYENLSVLLSVSLLRLYSVGFYLNNGIFIHKILSVILSTKIDFQIDVISNIGFSV